MPGNTRKGSAWIWHVKKYHAEHPELSYSQAMHNARATYKPASARDEYNEDHAEDQKGEGIISDLLGKAKKAITGAISSRLEARPLNIINVLKAYGTKKVNKITVCKEPIQAIVKSLLNALSGGDLARTVAEKGYDNVFHLFARLELEGGVIIRIEKNQRVSVAIGELRLGPSAKCESVTLPQQTTLQEFIDKGEALGNSHGSFWRYSAYEDNCQKFIRDLLNASGSKELDSFIMQDAGALVKSGFLRNLSKLATDAAAGVDYVWRGGHKDGKSCPECENAPHYRKVFLAYKRAVVKQIGKNATTDKQLRDLGHSMFGGDFIGVYSQDTMPIGKEGMYIVNVDTHEKAGTHWVACIETKDKIYIYDSFARELTGLMPILEQKLNKKSIDIQEKLDHPTQWGNSNLCGQNCLSFMAVAHEYGIHAAMHI